MTSGDPLSRRAFLAGVSAAGGGLTLGFTMPSASARAASAAAAAEVTAWLVVHPDNSIVIRVAHAEMGQGAQTGLAMLVAEELECDSTKVRTEFARPDSSCGATRSGVTCRLAQAARSPPRSSTAPGGRHCARDADRGRRGALAGAGLGMLCAREQDHAPPDRQNGNNGAVAEDATEVPVPAEVELKPPSAWKLAGTPRRRLDVAEKVTGQPVYAIDVRLPNMLYAAIRHSPVFGGTPKSVDESAIAAMKGVRRVVRMADAVAVIANSWWRAKTAIEALPIVWDDRGNAGVSSATIADTVRAALNVEKGQVGRADGDAADGLARATRRIEAEYTVPQRHRRLAAPTNADRERLLGFRVAPHDHVRDLFHLGVADALAERLVPLVDLDAVAGAAKLPRERAGSFAVALGDRQHANLHGREPEGERTAVVLDQDADEALEASRTARGG